MFEFKFFFHLHRLVLDNNIAVFANWERKVKSSLSPPDISNELKIFFFLSSTGCYCGESFQKWSAVAHTVDMT